MDQLSPQTVIAWKVCATTLHVPAILFTVFRLFVRSRMSQLWWDDYLVIVPSVVDVYYVVILWDARLTALASTGSADGQLVTNFWISDFPGPLVIWLSRSVLVLGLARLFPSASTARRVFLGLAICFSVVYISVMTETIYKCFASAQSLRIKFPLCPATPDMVLFRVLVVADIAGDLLAALIPLYIFWKIRLPPVERRIILFTFAAGIVSTSVPLVFAILNDTHKLRLGIAALMRSQLEGSLALLICNLLVVVSSGLRASRRRISTRKEVVAPAQSAHAMPITVDASSSLSTSISPTSSESESQTATSTGTTPHITLTQISDSYDNQQTSNFNPSRQWCSEVGNPGRGVGEVYKDKEEGQSV